MIFRPYQLEAYNDVHAVWRPGVNVLLVMPMGSGKTVIFCRFLAESKGYSFAIAHRQELVAQMSLTLAKNGIEHDILAPDPIIKWIFSLHVGACGRPYYKPRAKTIVAGIDTLTARFEEIKHLLKRTELWVTDEGHHVLRKNKWGKIINAFSQDARGLSVTATPMRADGAGLSRASDGVNDVMVIGPSGRELIDSGYLCDYRIYAPPMRDPLPDEAISKSTGDYNRNKLSTHMEKHPIVGDVVNEYLRHTPGKLGVTFAVDVAEAGKLAAAYRQRGVPAEVISAKTKGPDRQSLEAKFRRGELKQLVNVDIFGEGYDLPALEVCSMARPTASYALYCQQFGRPLRTMAGKSYGTVIDHVGNVVRHSTVGLPDARIEWSMERRDKRASSGPSDIIPVKSCVNCTQIYEAFHRCCPHCGFVTVPESRSAPKYVDGDLLELSPEVLEAMRAEVARIDEDPARLEMRVARAAGGRAAGSVVKHHRKRQETQTILRMVISDWADRQRAAGLSDPDSYRKFWYLFGVDVMTAQALNIKEAERLTERIVKNER